MVEEWRDIQGFKGYQISNEGRVRSFKKTKAGQQQECDLLVDEPHIMNTTSDDGNGYLKVMLRKGGKSYCRKIHRLVAEAFVPNPNNLETVDHISNNKLDNRPENLRWVSRHDNVSMAYKDNLHENDINERYKPVILRAVDNGYECVFGSTQEAASFLRVHYTSLSHAFKDRKPIRGYYVEILDSDRTRRRKEREKGAS